MKVFRLRIWLITVLLFFLVYACYNTASITPTPTSSTGITPDIENVFNERAPNVTSNSVPARDLNYWVIVKSNFLDEFKQYDSFDPDRLLKIRKGNLLGERIKCSCLKCPQKTTQSNRSMVLYSTNSRPINSKKFYIPLHRLGNAVLDLDQRNTVNFWAQGNDGLKLLLQAGEKINNEALHSMFESIRLEISGLNTTKTFYGQSIIENSPEESIGFVLTYEYGWDDFQSISDLWSSGKNWYPEHNGPQLATLKMKSCNSNKHARKAFVCDATAYTKPFQQIFPARCGTRAEIFENYQKSIADSVQYLNRTLFKNNG